ncbi:MAG TPA: FAD-dependent oxidoreductase [Candidatus Methylacidiphilales bacterium]|nr:FAD-dependent oxidoreductase [Candidatus Methylacidiphilales bacterium]
MQLDPIGYPELDATEIEAVKQAGRTEVFEVGDVLYKCGDRPVDCFVILSGIVEAIDSSGDQSRTIVEIGEGHFTGEITVLTGRASIVTCRAKTRCEAVRLVAPQMRRVMITCPSLGEKWLPALIRRREILEELQVQGFRIYGQRSDPATLALRDFLHRNGIVHRWLDTSDPAIGKTAASLGPAPLHYPLVVCSRHVLHQNPSLPELAEYTGVCREVPDTPWDLVIIGSGPSGLGAAVYAASEGLRTLVLDNVGPGGQAGSSARIENYAGFPSGLSGHDLAQRTYLQALKFGATFSAPRMVKRMARMGDGTHEMTSADGTIFKTKTILISTGVSYRTLGVSGLNRLRGCGIYYAATQIEATLCENRPVHIIGAGNSAGQAAMYLSKFTKSVDLVVRGGDLHKSMSSYLSERVESNPRVRIRLNTELRGVEGTTSLEKILLENTSTGERGWEESCAAFIFIGATPCTDFLSDDILKDDKGFIITGREIQAMGKWALPSRAPLPLETSSPGVFASGDCRSRTTKRVAFAVGDGALAVTCVHDLLGTYN